MLEARWRFAGGRQIRGAERCPAHHGNDHLVGAAGRDRLYGEHGRDLLEGGTGKDLVSGGRNADLEFQGIAPAAVVAAWCAANGPKLAL